MSTLLFSLGVIIFFVGIIATIKPIALIGLPTRKRALLAVLIGVVIQAANLEVPETTTETTEQAAEEAAEGAGLSALGLAWAERLGRDITAKHPDRIDETCASILNRLSLPKEAGSSEKKLTDNDGEILNEVCAEADDAQWVSAISLLAAQGVSISQPAATNNVSRPAISLPASTEVIGVRGIEIPVPEGSTVVEHSPSTDEDTNDVWLIESDSSDEELRQFYASSMLDKGWRQDNLQRNCWLTPRLGTSLEEILCFRPELAEPGRYLIRLAP